MPGGESSTRESFCLWETLPILLGTILTSPHGDTKTGECVYEAFYIIMSGFEKYLHSVMSWSPMSHAILIIIQRLINIQILADKFTKRFADEVANTQFKPQRSHLFHTFILLVSVIQLLSSLCPPRRNRLILLSWRYLGFSWASGVVTIDGKPYPNGRNEESSSESISAYEVSHWCLTLFCIDRIALHHLQEYVSKDNAVKSYLCSRSWDTSVISTNSHIAEMFYNHLTPRIIILRLYKKYVLIGHPCSCDNSHAAHSSTQRCSTTQQRCKTVQLSATQLLQLN